MFGNKNETIENSASYPACKQTHENAHFIKSDWKIAASILYKLFYEIFMFEEYKQMGEYSQD